ncbi:immunoglobulin domain-containing protein [Alkalimarinus coralli]|uniref:immunoglobulin domain-containing protein n=1 Tax=Alkalimarinus coralli TaxID=2935863 RepID=UPI00202AF52E|nr:immunoglobulin domain-containing protein [Alkalimarinus coralli]
MFLNLAVSNWSGISRQLGMRSISIFALSSMLAACGSGGGESGSGATAQGSVSELSSPAQTGKQISIQGGAIKGVIENGIVRIFSIESEAGLFRKAPIPLGDAERTDANGQFNVSIAADTIDAIVVEITADSDTRMTCDVVNGCGVNEFGNPIAFGEKFSLNSDFILEAAHSGLQNQEALTLYVTPLTHLAVTYAKENIDGLSEDSIGAAYSLVESTLNLSPGSLQLPPPDLTKLDAYESLSGDELQYAIMSASFLAMVNMPDWGSVDEVVNSAAERFAKWGALPEENGGVISEVTLDDLFYQASDIASDLQMKVDNEQIIVELVSVESSTEMYYQEVSSLYVDETNTIDTENQPGNIANTSGAEASQSGGVNNTSGVETNQSGNVANTSDAEASQSGGVNNTSGVETNQSGNVANTSDAEASQTGGGNNTSGVETNQSGNVANTSDAEASQTGGGNNTSGVETNQSGNVANTSGAEAGQSGDVADVSGSEQSDSDVNGGSAGGGSASPSLAISSHPGSVVVNVNGAAELSVIADGSGDIRYQWRKDGIEIEGQNGSTLKFDSVLKADAGVYDVLVSNDSGQIPSLAATLTVEDVAYTALLNWSIPVKRQDGSPLALGDIAGYVVAYGTEPENLSSQLLVDGAQSTSYPFEDLDPSKTYYFKIATVDTNNVQGEYSSVVAKNFL